jgi:REP element-mobilizing transposase RayT
VTFSAEPPGPRYRRSNVPRRPRRDLPDGHFHITARGVAGCLIFLDDHDRRRFLLLLEQVSELWGWEVIAWCLMGTHYHLVVRARREQMSYAVHRLNGLYAQAFNRRHERGGHLFENRFSSWVIRDEEHFRKTIDYVLENPVRAGLCRTARDWLWSWSKVRLPVDVVVAARAF